MHTNACSCQGELCSLRMGRGGNQSECAVGDLSARGHRSPGADFESARARDQIQARFARAREVSQRRAASLIYSAEEGSWKVIEVFADAMAPQRSRLEVADPSDPRQVELAYSNYLAQARAADIELGFATA